MRRFRPKKRFKRKKSISRSRFFWDTILFFILGCSIFYFLFLSNIFQIREIQIAGPAGMPYWELREIVKEELNKDFLYFFTASSFFLVQAGSVEKKILKQYPDIETVELQKKFPNALFLEIKKKQPVAQLCFSADNCFLIDSEGIIYRGSPPASLVAIFKEQGKIKNPGEQAISPEEMNQILRIKSELKKLEIEAVKFVLREGKRMDVKTADGWEIYFDLSGDINLALTKLHLLLEKEISPEERRNLKYINLRFSKIYYK